MLKRSNIVIAVIAVLLATCTAPGTAVAQKDSAPKPQDKLALGENEAKQLLLLIDADKTGKISKQEWMKFMEAEFDRLDVEKNGELDVRELTQSKLRVSHFASVGK
jgi:Ca2+-binding EF-hand superfamily protein